MQSLLVQSCSSTKHRVQTPVPALDLYDGYFFRIIKKAQRAGRFQPGLDMVIISAEHGIVEPDDEIGYYDRRMDSERASGINDKVINKISNKVGENQYDEMWINMGQDYMPAVYGVEDAVDIPVLYIEGDGIGTKGKRLKELVSSGHSTPVHGD